MLTTLSGRPVSGLDSPSLLVDLTAMGPNLERIGADFRDGVRGAFVETA